MLNKIHKNISQLFISLFFALLLCTTAGFTQNHGKVVPKQEIRAVWVTTVLGLDWPKSKDIAEQKRSLLEIIQKTASAKFNTIYFQVRGRADAMYVSHYEPWSHMLTGELGKDPGWDPLEFVIVEGHKRGMEVHAWFNTFLIKSGKDKPNESIPRHLILSHPEWVKLVKGEWWLDAGIPEARQYILNVAMDIVRNYDIDGIHFDFLRYSPNDFPDDKTWKKLGHNQPKDEWRRNNLNNFVRAFYDSAISVKPLLKVGATPIGIYNTDVFKHGMRGYEDVFQDAKSWLREGKMDYIVPQVYWSLKDTIPGPDFARVTNDWIKGSSGRQIFIGIAAYKDDVFQQLTTLIDTARALGANGEAFFRYENIRRMFDSVRVYETLANIPPMKWKDSLPPNSPPALHVTRDLISPATISWMKPKQAADGDTGMYYDLYRSQQYPVDIQNAYNLIAQVSGSSRIIIDSMGYQNGRRYYYAVTAIDKEHNESDPVQEEPLYVPEVLAALQQFQGQWRLGNLLIDKSQKLAFIPYELKELASLKISIWDTSKTNVFYSFEEKQVKGRHISTIDLSQMKKGQYLLQVESQFFTAQKHFSLKN